MTGLTRNTAGNGFATQDTADRGQACLHMVAPNASLLRTLRAVADAAARLFSGSGGWGGSTLLLVRVPFVLNGVPVFACNCAKFHTKGSEVRVVFDVCDFGRFTAKLTGFQMIGLRRFGLQLGHTSLKRLNSLGRFFQCFPNWGFVEDLQNV